MMTQALRHLAEIDPCLDKIIRRTKIPVIHWSGYVFEDLVSCILDMQIRYRGKAVRYKKLKALLDNKPITYQNLWSIGDEGFKILNISRQKYHALIALCTHWEKNQLDAIDWHALPNETVRFTLSKIKGIGNWTIDVILLYTLQRKNIVPFDDFHLKKVMKSVYHIKENENLKKEMQEIAQDWSPYGSIAVLYLLAYKKAML